MGSLHWLIVIPFYLFGSITLLLSFILVAGWVTLEAFAGRVLVVLIVASFALAGLDTLLQPLVPLPLDEELREGEPAKTRISGRAASIE